MTVEVIKLPYDTPEWLAFRKGGIGGSDAAAAIGKSPHKSNTELWAEKRGLYTPKDISDNPRVKYGKEAEEPMTRLFTLDHPQYEYRSAKDVIFKRDFMFASLDGILIERATGRKGFLEDKTAELNSRTAAEKWDGYAIPEHYYIQILHYFIVTGFAFCYVKARLIDNDRYGEVTITELHRHYERENLAEDILYLYEQEKRFWGYVESGKRPPAIFNF